jgi:hypothetical protein
VLRSALICVVPAVAISLLPVVTSRAQQSRPGPTTSVALAAPTTPPGLADLDKDVDERVGKLAATFALKGPFSGIVAVAPKARSSRLASPALRTLSTRRLCDLRRRCGWPR